MLVLYLLLVAFGLETQFSSGATTVNPERPYCFEFTWLAKAVAGTTLNCTATPHQPCFPPLQVTTDLTPPNTTWMWENKNQNEISCLLTPGTACLKYTDTIKDAVQNVTYFCGKIIDEENSVNSGCFEQQLNGHTIEVCACESDPGRMPCNSSNATRSLMKTLIILTIISTFFPRIAKFLSSELSM